MDRRYRDFHLATGVSGYPTLGLRNATTAVVGDWSGCLTLVDLDKGDVVRRAYVGAYVGQSPVCNILQSAAVEPCHCKWCCVATRGGFAALWNMDTSETVKIQPVTYGPVNATAFSPSDQLLIVGTGMYPLDGSEQMAAVEVWGGYGTDKWTCLRTARLPGVSCDALKWMPDGTAIVAVVGAVSQQESFVIWLDPDDLHISALCRIDAPGPCHGRVAPVESGTHRAIVGFRDRIVLLEAEERSPILWSRETDAARRFGYEEQSDRVLTTDGHVLAASSGDVIDTLPVLEGCEDVDVRPDGGFIGASRNGVLRCWDL